MKRPDDIEPVAELSVRTLKGRRCKALRKATGMSASQVARRMEVPDKTVARIDAGKASDEMIERYLQAIGRSAADLFSLTPPYPGVSTAARPRRLRVVGNDPPGLDLISDTSSPATSRALSSALAAKVVRPKPVASQRIAVDRVTSQVAASDHHARGPSPDGRR